MKPLPLAAAAVAAAALSALAVPSIGRAADGGGGLSVRSETGVPGHGPVRDDLATWVPASADSRADFRHDGAATAA